MDGKEDQEALAFSIVVKCPDSRYKIDYIK